MNKWVKRMRGMLGMGLTWAAGWALFGILIGVTSLLVPGLFDPFFRVFDAPLPALAVPGFVGGVIFSVVLGVAGRRHKFSELSLPRFAAWGAVGGVLLSLVPAAMGAVGLLTTDVEGPGIWDFTAAIIGPLTLLSAISASGSLLLARRAKDRALLDAIQDAENDQVAARSGQRSLSEGALRVSTSPQSPRAFEERGRQHTDDIGK